MSGERGICSHCGRTYSLNSRAGGYSTYRQIRRHAIPGGGICPGSRLAPATSEALSYRTYPPRVLEALTRPASPVPSEPEEMT